MEEDQELKHVCKFCSKSFSCGRSLGGHMRSHMINDITAQADGTKLTKKKLPSLVIINNGANNSIEATNGYVLRENPKKTRRLADHSSDQDTSILEKSCQECGKIFPSLKALFGHMKCHSTEKEKFSLNNTVVNDDTEKKNNNSLEEEGEEEQDSWTSGDHNNQKLVMDSQSDNETAAAAAPNRRKRSQRRTRYMMGTAANSSSLSFPNNNASSSVSEIEQEEEEVAICLMLLSRDVGQWGGGGGGLNSVAECSDNNSVFLEKKTEGKSSVCIETETLMMKVESRKTEFPASGFSRKGSKKKKSQLEDESVVENSGIELGKRKFGNSFDLEASKNSDRNSRFECTTCNKIFHSYQALGGHRASHKKNKGCFATRIHSTENSIETEQLSPDQTPADDSKLIINSIKNEISVVDYDKRAETKKSKGHECPICFKVFPSGQALGGHKRSHLVAGNEAKNTRNLPIQEPIPPPIRDFLDLNLPAPVEEDTNGLLGFNQWWIASSHKHESLLGLISN